MTTLADVTGSAIEELLKFEPDQPRADDGKWTDGGGGGGSGAHSATGARVSPRERAQAALADPAFRTKHEDRLRRADEEARRNFPGRESSPHAHEAATNWTRSEAQRILAEHDAHGNDEGLKDAATLGRIGGKSLVEQHESAMSAIASEKQHRIKEQVAEAERNAAIAAGHVTTEARDISERYIAESALRQQQVDGHLDALDQAHHDAAQALADLHQLEHDGNDDDDDGLEFEHTHSLSEAFHDTQASADDSHPGYEHEGRDAPLFPEHVPHPDDIQSNEDYAEYVPHPDELEGDDKPKTPDDYAAALREHEAFRQSAQAAHDEYQRAMEAHATELKARAESAQAALERLHEHQLATAKNMKQLAEDDELAREKVTDRLNEFEDDHHVNHAAFAEHERDYGEDDDGNELTHEDVDPAEHHDPEKLVNDKARSEYERAYTASERIVANARSRLDEHGLADHSNTLDSLQDEMKATKAAIRELSRHTGRAPRLPEKPAKPSKTKKSANRPGAAAHASVPGMAPPYYRLRIKTLKFISAVDAGAQGAIANVALIKRAPRGSEVEAQFHVAKVDEKLGLVFGWALASTLDGGATPHVDLQQDAVIGDDALIKVAAEFVEAGARSDVLHDENPDGKIVFAMPLTKEVCGALGIKSDVHGLAIAMRPSPATFKRFLSRELNAFSIGGTGERELVKAVRGKESALGGRRALRKQAVLTSAVDGHQHTVDLDDPAEPWRDQLSTSYQTSTGATQGHSHAWTYDPTTGQITIAQDSGHSHTVDAVVPPEVLSQVAANADGQRCAGCNEMCEQGCRFCPGCGARMSSSAPPSMAEGAKPAGAAVVVVAARAGAGISTPAQPAPTVANTTQESPPMNKQDPTPANAPANPSAGSTAGPPTDPKPDPRMPKLLAAALALPEPQRVFASKLPPEDQVTFLTLGPAERESALKAADDADPVVYTTKRGVAIRKSASALELTLAKQGDEQAELLAKQAQELEVEKSERARVQIEKRATDLIPLIGKSLAERVAIVKVVDGITDEAVRNGAIEALKGANAAFTMLGKSIGVGDDPGPANKTPHEAWDVGLADFAKSKNIVNKYDAIVPFLKTDQGKALKKAMDAQRPVA